MYRTLTSYIEKLDTATLSEARKGLLMPMVDYIKEKASAHRPILLNFICTHNSRRSHLAQVWAQAMAEYFKVPNIQCYSGGTEATALHSMIVQTLGNTGFKISNEPKNDNPVYKISYSEDAPPILGFSKMYDDRANPESGFAAVMTCSQADAGCPIVTGSERRFSITYEDPKISDGTPQQERIYLERSEQIAMEMKYVFSIVRS